MLRKALVLCLGGALWIGAIPARAEAQVTDPEVLKGIRLVDDGDYDAAIVLLDSAARRLASDTAKVRDLSQAYLYLGIAYVGKGHEAAAKAKFREAVSRIKDLTLSADKYPPKVIDLFEAAKDEARAAAPAPGPSAPSTTASTRRAEPAEKGGGGKKLLIIAGLGAVAAGGTAFALTRGGESFCDTVYVDPRGILNTTQSAFEFSAGPAIEGGQWKAQVKWTVVSTSSKGPSIQSSRGAVLPLGVKLEVFSGSQKIAESRLLTDTESIAEWEGAASTVFLVKGFLQGGTGGLSYELVIDGPCVN